MILEVFLWISAIGFWAIVGLACYRTVVSKFKAITRDEPPSQL